jgi:hypothetical protein
MYQVFKEDKICNVEAQVQKLRNTSWNNTIVDHFDVDPAVVFMRWNKIILANI